MAVEVKVTSVLQKITGAKVVQGQGGTVGELLTDLDARYPVFGTVIAGMEVVDWIRQGDVINRMTVIDR